MVDVPPTRDFNRVVNLAGESLDPRCRREPGDDDAVDGGGHLLGPPINHWLPANGVGLAITAPSVRAVVQQ
ncbi:hypothetical protein Aduo_017992 [Ancylostoma duodenale]